MNNQRLSTSYSPIMTILHSSLHKYIHIVHDLHCILRNLYMYFSKPLRLLYFTQIFIYFSKPLRLLYSLIIYEIVNFSFFTLYSLLLLSFFLYLKSVPMYVIVHVLAYVLHVYTYVTPMALEGILYNTCTGNIPEVLINTARGRSPRAVLH